MFDFDEVFSEMIDLINSSIDDIKEEIEQLQYEGVQSYVLKELSKDSPNLVNQYNNQIEKTKIELEKLFQQKHDQQIILDKLIAIREGSIEFDYENLEKEWINNLSFD